MQTKNAREEEIDRGYMKRKRIVAPQTQNKIRIPSRRNHKQVINQNKEIGEAYRKKFSELCAGVLFGIILIILTIFTLNLFLVQLKTDFPIVISIITTFFIAIIIAYLSILYMSKKYIKFFQVIIIGIATLLLAQLSITPLLLPKVAIQKNIQNMQTYYLDGKFHTDLYSNVDVSGTPPAFPVLFLSCSETKFSNLIAIRGVKKIDPRFFPTKPATGNTLEFCNYKSAFEAEKMNSNLDLVEYDPSDIDTTINLCYEYGNYPKAWQLHSDSNSTNLLVMGVGRSDFPVYSTGIMKFNKSGDNYTFSLQTVPNCSPKVTDISQYLTNENRCILVYHMDWSANYSQSLGGIDRNQIDIHGSYEVPITFRLNVDNSSKYQFFSVQLYYVPANTTFCNQ